MPNRTQQQGAADQQAQDNQREPPSEGEQNLPIVIPLVPRLVLRRDPHQREQRKHQPTDSDQCAAGKPSRPADTHRRAWTKPPNATGHGAFPEPQADGNHQQDGTCDQSEQHAGLPGFCEIRNAWPPSHLSRPHRLMLKANQVRLEY